MDLPYAFEFEMMDKIVDVLMCSNSFRQAVEMLKKDEAGTSKLSSSLFQSMSEHVDY